MANREISQARFKLRSFTKCLSFDGVDDLATVPITPLTTGFSVGFWFNTGRNGAGFDRVLAWIDVAKTQGFHILTNGNILAAETYDTTGNSSPTIDTNLSVSKWKHVTVTFVPNSLKTYLNGVLIQTDTSCSMADATGIALTIARRPGSANWWKGEMAEFCFQNTTTPWTQAQIDDLYYRAIAPSGSTFYSLNDTNLDQNGENGLTVTGATYVTDVPHGPRTSVTNRQVVRDFGKSLSFNGSSDYATCPITPALTGFSMSFWIYLPTAPGASKDILSWVQAFSNGFHLESDGTKARVFDWQVFNGTSSLAQFPAIPIGKWCMMTVTFDGTISTLYFNSVSGATLNKTMGAGASVFSIGRRSTADRYCACSISDFVFQNTTTPWTQNQINDLYWRGIKPSGASWYNFNDNVNDQSGLGQNLTLSSGTYSTNKPFGSSRSVV